MKDSIHSFLPALASACLSTGCVEAPIVAVEPIEVTPVIEFDPPVMSDQIEADAGDHAYISQRSSDYWVARIQAVMAGVLMLYLVKYRFKPVHKAFDWVQGKDAGCPSGSHRASWEALKGLKRPEPPPNSP